MPSIAERLNYPMSERTRLHVRVEIYDEDTDRPRIEWFRNCRTFEEAQRRYIGARDESGLGASGFGDGEVIDEMGQAVARISYNGRLREPLPWHPGAEPIAEAPSTSTPGVGKPDDDSDPAP